MSQVTKPLKPGRDVALEPCCADERWMPLPHFEDSYEVSSCGRFWSIPRWIEASDGLVYGVGGKLLSAQRKSDSYRIVLGHKEKSINVVLSRVVLELFFGPAAPGEDAKLTDPERGCHLHNLRWAYPTDWSQELVADGRLRSGERHQNAKLSDDEADLIRSAARHGVKQRDLAGHFKVSEALVSLIVNGLARTCSEPPIPGASIGA